MKKAFKVAIGAGAILIGIYIALKEFSIILTIIGLLLVAVGIGFITSD